MAKKPKKNAWKKERKKEHLPLREYPYFIFCEGTKTEPNYFEGFRKIINEDPIYKDLVWIQIEPIGGETLYILEQAEKYVSDHNIKKGQIWCVYDKDSFPADRFDSVVDQADKLNANSGDVQYRCAWSNQCIELWFILHFSFYQSDNDRSMYIDNLNKVFAGLKLGKYKKNMDNIFNTLAYDGNPKLAIKYAKRLVEQMPGDKPSQVAPGTKVYELVEELAQYLPEDVRTRFL